MPSEHAQMVVVVVVVGIVVLVLVHVATPHVDHTHTALYYVMPL